MCPAVKRALNEVQEVLTKLGHEIIEIDIPNINHQCANHMKLFTNEMCEFIIENWNVQGDDLGGINLFTSLKSGPPLIVKALATLAKIFKQHRLSENIEIAMKIDNDGFTEIVQHRDVHLEEINKIWVENQLD